ncbi:helix-hairpin-helix domain-containing protein [Taibaiella soli]|uniref:Helix-hairpin-helix domain-containing protein n=1 Tax=Taibaiella soli TaxID=1649169 RepID=A0A2W2ADT3_9BACT|nr:helix-hairpin-helix domain-containing protein [Taibaiella soli]PZF73431.1 hypothetical protein DN068_08555 [Taibaiella soli]
MKKIFLSYFSFTQSERRGASVLIILLLILQAVFFTMSFMTVPYETTAEEAEWRLAWVKRQMNERAEETKNGTVPDMATLFSFDPNTLDSAEFRKLGLKEKTVHLLLNWRRKGKVFYKKEDLKPLYTLSDADYERIEPFIKISNTTGAEHFSSYPTYKREPEPAFLNLNSTDSASLVKLNGIGPTLAHKIVARRQALGGFINYEQLLEIYRFPDSTFQQLQQKLRIDPSAIIKIKLNTCSIEQLKAHPYIGEKVGNNIILLRNGLGHYENIEQLKQVPLMNAEIYRKIAPYFIAE